jgi:hypothetical protein
MVDRMKHVILLVYSEGVSIISAFFELEHLDSETFNNVHTSSMAAFGVAWLVSPVGVAGRRCAARNSHRSKTFQYDIQRSLLDLDNSQRTMQDEYDTRKQLYNSKITLSKSSAVMERTAHLNRTRFLGRAPKGS